MGEVEIGIVHDYYAKIGVGAIEITDGELAVGDTIHIKGHTTDVTATVHSMQREHEAIDMARKGDMAGVKLAEKVRRHDKVLKVTEQ